MNLNTIIRDNSKLILQVKQEAVSVPNMSSKLLNTNQSTVNGFTLVTIGYIKKGKIIRNVFIAEKAQWERDSEGLTLNYNLSK